MIESIPVEGEITKKENQRMTVVNDLKAETFKEVVERTITQNTISYSKFKELDIEHRPKIIPTDKVNEILPWVHIAISNAKRLLLDIPS